MNGRRRCGPLVPIALALGLAACGGSGSSQTGSSGNAFTFLSVNSVTPACATSALGASSSTVVTVTLSNTLKNPTITAATSLDNVVIESYTVRLTRSNGGPSTGPFTQGTSVTIPAGGNAPVQVLIVPADRKGEVGGPGSGTASTVLNGHNGRGQRLSVDASVPVNFVAGNAGDGQTCSASYGASLFQPLGPAYALLALIGLVIPPLTRRLWRA